MSDRLTLSVVGAALLVVASVVAVALLLTYDYPTGITIVVVSALAASLILSLCAIGISWRRKQQ